jgi:hypothetical protein
VLTVLEVLERAGHPPGRRLGTRWRTTCPVHRGDNREAFSYTSEVWHCFVCGESGGVVKLARALGVLEERVPRPGIEGVPDLRDLLRKDRMAAPEPKVTEHLAVRAAETRARVRAVADRIHVAAELAQYSDIPRWLDQMAVEYQDDPDMRGEAFDTAARWWAEVGRWKDVAHRLYIVSALDPVLAAHDMTRALHCALIDAGSYCPCEGVALPPRGTRARPWLA